MNTATVTDRRAESQHFGDFLRRWRQRRRLSQLELAHEAEISARHLSFVETGRSLPSRGMVLRLAERLDVPLRERNALLVAAGYAPMYRERPLGDPALAAARQAVELILKGHEPYPALAMDRHWNLVAGNAVLPHLFAGADPALLQGQANVLRLSLHPGAWRQGSATWLNGAAICSSGCANRSTPPATACSRPCSMNCAAIRCPTGRTSCTWTANTSASSSRCGFAAGWAC